MTEKGPDGRRDEELRDGDEPEVVEHGRAEADDDTDVVLDIPVLNVEELDLEVEELRAHVSARAELAGFLNIDIGVSAYVDKVKLHVKGIEAQVQLKVKLERILGSVDRALEAIDNNPQILDPDFRRSSGEPRDEEEDPRQITAGAEEMVEESAEDPARDGAEPGATAAARKKAAELGLDLSSIEGTGSGGRVLIQDVKKAAGG